MRQQEKQQQGFVTAANASLKRQETAVESLGEVRTKLDDALRTAEPWRQASWTATRVAIVALLIFLVQIVVNRYRYLQRLAGFYQARAHALRVLAATESGADVPLMRGVTMTELIGSLSPDTIGFDKAADPPTHHVATLLQSALRRG